MEPNRAMDEKISPGKHKNTAVLLYAPAFFGVWAVYELLLFPGLRSAVSGEFLLRLINDCVIKNLLWTVPAVLLICRFREEVKISLKEMFTTKVKWLRILPFFAFFAVYILAGSLLQNGGLTIRASFSPADVLCALMAGFTEEMVFRGWLLNISVREEKKWAGILLNGLLFLAIHFPIWIREGVFISSFADMGFLCIFALSLCFSWTFLKTRNIVVPMALHAFWDLMMFLLL